MPLMWRAGIQGGEEAKRGREAPGRCDFEIREYHVTQKLVMRFPKRLIRNSAAPCLCHQLGRFLSLRSPVAICPKYRTRTETLKIR